MNYAAFLRQTRRHRLTVIIFLWFFLAAPLALQAAEHLKFMTIDFCTGLKPGNGLMRPDYDETKEEREIRYQGLMHEIRTLRPDVIAINNANPLPGFARRLGRDLGYDYLWHWDNSLLSRPFNLRKGNCLLARPGLKLTAVGNRRLSGGPSHKHTPLTLQDGSNVLLARIQTPEGPAYVAVTSLHAAPPENSWTYNLMGDLMRRWGYTNDDYWMTRKTLQDQSDWRRHEARDLLDYLNVRVPGRKPLILMGNFNSEISWPDMQPMLASGLTDTYGLKNTDPGYTWDARINTNIDRFYIEPANHRHAQLYTHLCEYMMQHTWRTNMILINQTIKPGQVTAASLCGTRLYRGRYPSTHFGVITTISRPLAPRS